MCDVFAWAKFAGLQKIYAALSGLVWPFSNYNTLFATKHKISAMI
jgi:hypothetical protein